MTFKAKTISDRIIVMILFAVVLTKSAFSSRLGFSLIDEGEYLHNALRILNGEIPYRDFFSYQPPLYNYWNILAFKIFGQEVYSPRLLNSIVFAVAVVLFYLIARRFSSKLASFAVSVSFALMELSMERLYYYVFVFLGLLTFFKYFRVDDRKLLISGMLLGVVSLFRFDVGLLYLLGLCAGLLFGGLSFDRASIAIKIKRMTYLWAGYLVPVFFGAFWMSVSETLETFIKTQIATPLQITSYNSLPIPRLWEVLPRSIAPRSLFHSYETAVFYFFVMVFIVVGVRTAKSWKDVWKHTPEVIFLFIISTLMLPYMLGRSDLGHIVKASVPTFLLLSYLITALKGHSWKLALCVFVLGMVVVGTLQVMWSDNFYNTKVATKNGIIRLNEHWPEGSVLVSANTVSRTLLFVEDGTDEDETVFFAPYMPGMYFLADQPSNTYVGNILHTYLTDEIAFIDTLDELNVEVVVYDPEGGPVNEDGPMKLRSYYPNLHKYIVDNYTTIETTPEGWQLMKKNL
ncbi:ArnT family glycosyltransferase [Patescibacteria group bacterium]